MVTPYLKNSHESPKFTRMIGVIVCSSKANFIGFSLKWLSGPQVYPLITIYEENHNWRAFFHKFFIKYGKNKVHD